MTKEIMKVRDRATGPFQHQRHIDNASCGRGLRRSASAVQKPGWRVR